MDEKLPVQTPVQLLLTSPGFHYLSIFMNALHDSNVSAPCVTTGSAYILWLDSNFYDLFMSAQTSEVVLLVTLH